MSPFIRFLSYLVLTITITMPARIFADNATSLTILCYHNFNPTTPGSMNLTPQRLEEQFKWLKDNGFTVIPLKQAAEYLQGIRTSLPAKSVVITVDDGWKSAYHYMYPLARKYDVPVTLFIYPQTISKGKHALTWSDLKELQHTGLFDIQSHTYSHPNFKQAKKKLSNTAYEKFVTTELVNSKKILEQELEVKISYLAWPFGIYDNYLEEQAARAGYAMAFTIDAKHANKSDRPMAQPRYMILQGQSMKRFANIMNNEKIKSIN